MHSICVTTPTFPLTKPFPAFLDSQWAIGSLVRTWVLLPCTRTKPSLNSRHFKVLRRVLSAGWISWRRKRSGGCRTFRAQFVNVPAFGGLANGFFIPFQKSVILIICSFTLRCVLHPIFAILFLA